MTGWCLESRREKYARHYSVNLNLTLLQTDEICCATENMMAPSKALGDNS